MKDWALAFTSAALFCITVIWCVYIIRVGMVLAFLLAVTIEYRCVKWVWVGDVYNRKVYCIEWKKVDKK
jgi:hypothetical protein